MMAEQAAKKVASPLYLGFDFSTQQVESKISVRPTALHAVKCTDCEDVTVAAKSVDILYKYLKWDIRIVL